MRVRVAIDVTVPLKKEWRVRASNGDFVTVYFKYEKLGVFCHKCGLIGHTDKVCSDLFELEADDGVRNWGADLKPVTQRIGTAAANRWLQDPIPASMPQHNSHNGAAPVGRDKASEGVGNSVNFNDRMLAFQSQLTAMKQDVIAAQNSMLIKKGNAAISVCNVHLLPSSSKGTSASSLLPGRPLVLGLPAVPFSSDSNNEAPDESGSDLKKRKRMLALQNEKIFAAEGDVGNFVIGPNVSHGGDIDMHVFDDPLGDEQIVTAGPDAQAFLDK